MDSEFLDIPNYLKDKETGWLTPDGTFYKCEYGFHLDTLVEVFDIDNYAEAARRGIVHIYWDPTNWDTYEYYTERILTDAQIKYLHDQGFRINVKDLPHGYDPMEVNAGL